MKDPLLTHIGKIMWCLRWVQGSTIAELSELIGIPQPTISNAENLTAHPTINTIKMYSDFFDISISTMFLLAERPEVRAAKGKRAVLKLIGCHIMLAVNSPKTPRVEPVYTLGELHLERVCADGIPDTYNVMTYDNLKRVAIRDGFLTLTEAMDFLTNKASI